MQAEKVNFGKYGKTFQEGLVQLIFEDRPFADQITEVLDVNFLELEYLRVFLRKTVDYRARYDRHPSSSTMDTIIHTELSDEDELVAEQVKEYFEKIVGYEVGDREYIKETSLDFCRKQTLKEAMMKSVGLFKPVPSTRSPQKSTTHSSLAQIITLVMTTLQILKHDLSQSTANPSLPAGLTSIIL